MGQDETCGAIHQAPRCSWPRRNRFLPLRLLWTSTGCYFFIRRYRTNKRTAPPIASNRLRKSNPATLPHPSKDPIYPPTKAPTIPNKIVTISPPGSLPGMMSFASAPTINPITIQDKIPIVHPLYRHDWHWRRFRRTSGLTSAQPPRRLHPPACILNRSFGKKNGGNSVEMRFCDRRQQNLFSHGIAKPLQVPDQSFNRPFLFSECNRFSSFSTPIFRAYLLQPCLISVDFRIDTSVGYPYHRLVLN